MCCSGEGHMALGSGDDKAGKEFSGFRGSMGPANGSTEGIKRSAAYLSAYMNQEEDWSFRENSIRDVTDCGREDAIGALVKALGTAFKRAHASPQGAVSTARGDVDGPKLPLSDPSDPVMELMKKLRAIRNAWTSTSTSSDPAAAIGVLRQLEGLPVDVECLKKTKIALELNHDFWKLHAGSDARERAASLVRKWKVMYRAGQGKGGPSEQRLRIAATDLESAVMYHFRRDRGDEKVAKNTYARKHDTNHFQGALSHQKLTQEVINLLEKEPKLAVAQLEGHEKATDIVKKAGKALQMRDLIRGTKRPHSQI